MPGANQDMNRAFISLYMIIVLSIILLGVALNKFWDVMSPAVELDPAIEDLIQIIETNIAQSDSIDKEQKIRNLWGGLHYHVRLIELNDFAQTEILEKLKNGEIVNVSRDNEIQYYKRLNDSKDVLVLGYKSENYQTKPIYLGFILLFYSAIALVIFLWVWPLSRDLARLAQQTHDIGKDNIPHRIKVSPRSVLFPFALAFNTMAKRLNELIKSQKEMTYAVSHELRTPLARMKFALAMVDGMCPTKPLLKQVESLKLDVADMESLINSLLAYAAFEQQSKPLSQRAGHIHDLLQAIIARLTLHKNLNVQILINDRSQGEVFVCEWGLMQTALQNLLDNALSFAREKIIITLSTDNTDYRIDIEDDGPGVPSDQSERIFESFVRLYNDDTTGVPLVRSGFGLGLAIVRRIIVWNKDKDKS
jgi:signal transduction histidine kinase